MYNIDQLNEMLVSELRELAQKLSIPDSESLKKQELIYKILDSQTAGTEAPKEEIKKPAIEITPEQEAYTPKLKLKRKRIILDEPTVSSPDGPKDEIVNEPEKIAAPESIPESNVIPDRK